MTTRLLAVILGLALLSLALWTRSSAVDAPVPRPDAIDRSPVDLVLTTDGKLLTANQTSHTVSLLDSGTGEILAETPCGKHPTALALTPDGKQVLVTGTFSGDLTILTRDGDRLEQAAVVPLGFWEPRGVAVAPDGRLAYVALTTGNAVAVVDLPKRQVVQKIDVGRWPRTLALAPDGKRLAVGVNGDGGVAVVDTETRERLYTEDFVGLNLGQMQTSRDGRYVYFPWIVYRNNPITASTIREGWVLASRIARVRLDGHVRREAIALDVRGQAVADPHGLALSPDESWLVCAASGSQELLVYRTDGLPFIDYGGPPDHIDPHLLASKERFGRIPLGGRPMGVRFSSDGKEVFIANYLLNAVQVVDLDSRKVTRTLALGGPKEPSLARKGEAIFYDGRRSLDQWYSCHSCHYEGHTNAVTMDTRNDGRSGNFKTVLSLRNVTRTGPWFWHGWQQDLAAAVKSSLVDTMLGKEPSADDVKALLAYLDTLTVPTNPYRQPDGGLSEAAKRGAAVFRGEKAGCVRCHGGEYFTSDRVYEVGLGDRGDVYKGFSPPSLLGIYDRTRLLHDGRAKSLDEVLRGPHNPAKVTGKGALTEQELNDLVAYLRSL